MRGSDIKFQKQRDGLDKQWFNIFVIHQNRDKGRGIKNCVHESMIPDWIDLVLWGHEHESDINPVESTQGYHITQPGSTVATSLVEGEAKTKHCGILDIKFTKGEGPEFRLQPVVMKKVRPFKMNEIILNNGLDGFDGSGG